MKSPSPLLIFTLLIFCSCGLSFSSEWKKLDKGLYYKKITYYPGSTRQDMTHDTKFLLHAFKIDPQYYQLTPLLPTNENRATVKSLTESSNALLAINSNFFDPEGKALGLVIKNGNLLNAFKNISWWGVFYMDQSKPFIVHSQAFENNPAIISAIQAGPRLVVNGKIPPLKDEKSPKTAIGINHQQNMILVVSQDFFSIKDLAQIMSKPESKGGLECDQALNLDGGSSSQLYAKVNSFELDLPSFIKIPVGLGVMRREITTEK